MKAIKKLFKILRLLTIFCMEKPPIVMLHTALGRFYLGISFVLIFWTDQQLTQCIA